MKRKKLIPLLLFLLLLLLILCAWCHSGDILKNRAVNSSQVTSMTSSSAIQKDIDFKFVKKENNLELTGNFSTDKSVQILHTALGNTNFNNLSTINKELSPKEGVVVFTQKLLVQFNEYYKDGSVSYADGTLSVEGIVESEADKNSIATLLANSSINSQNNTRVVLPGPTAEELAEAKEEARLAALAQEEAEKQAQLEAEAKAKELAEAKAKEEAEAKAKEEARLAALAQEEAEKAKLKAKALEDEIKSILSHENINFELNKATLTEKSIDTVSRIAAILKENPTVHVEISGHTDSLGDDTYNLNLSQKRVDSVKEKLVQMEIDGNRLKAVGYGETQPLVSNDTKENRHTNRRVEFKILGE